MPALRSAAARRRATLARPVLERASIALALASGLLATGLSLSPSAEAARPRVYAIQGARIIVSPGKVLDSGVVVIRDGTIADVGKSVEAPPDAEIVDGKGLTVVAGFIDPFTRIGIPKLREEPPAGQAAERPRPAEKPVERGPGRPNAQVRSDARAALLYQAPAEAELEKMRAQGFTSALVVPDGGTFRGTSALVHLAGDDRARAALVPDVAAHLAFETAPEGSGYPDSLMGVIAFIRQTFLDAQRQQLWEERWKEDPRGLERPPLSPTLGAVAEILKGKRCIAETDDPHAFPRIVAIGTEFSFKPIIVGSGYEYEILPAVERAGLELIAPVAFPEPPHLLDAQTEIDVTLKDLRRWDKAPGNLAALEKAKIPFALTTHRLRSAGDFAKNVRKAIERGLSRERALEAVTVTPARLLGVESFLGTVEKGKIADLILIDGELFGESTKVKKLFVDGNPVAVEEESRDFDPNAKIDPRGTWEITYTFRGQTTVRTWTIGGAPGAFTGTAETQAGKVPLASLVLTGNKLTGTYTAGSSGIVEFTWIITGEELSGTSITAGGTKIKYTGRRTAKPEGGGL